MFLLHIFPLLDMCSRISFATRVEYSSIFEYFWKRGVFVTPWRKLTLSPKCTEGWELWLSFSVGNITSIGHKCRIPKIPIIPTQRSIIQVHSFRYAVTENPVSKLKMDFQEINNSKKHFLNWTYFSASCSRKKNFR